MLCSAAMSTYNNISFASMSGGTDYFCGLPHSTNLLFPEIVCFGSDVHGELDLPHVRAASNGSLLYSFARVDSMNSLCALFSAVVDGSVQSPSISGSLVCLGQSFTGLFGGVMNEVACAATLHIRIDSDPLIGADSNFCGFEPFAPCLHYAEVEYREQIQLRSDDRLMDFTSFGRSCCFACLQSICFGRVCSRRVSHL